VKLTARLVLVAITVLVIVIFYVPLGHADYTGLWQGGTYGAVMERGVDARVVSVIPGSPADRAGIRAGDALQVVPFSSTYPAFAFPQEIAPRSRCIVPTDRAIT